MYKWVVKQLAKERCGIWPLQFPAWFPFQGCCKIHDIAYTTLRFEAVELLKGAGGVPAEAWLEEFFKHRVLQADRMFIMCMHSSAGVFTAPVARVFSRVVQQVGWHVWLRGTLRIYEAMDLGGRKEA